MNNGKRIIHQIWKPELKRMRKVLPLADPLISVYPMFANPLSIILTKQDNYGWMLNNFIQTCQGLYALNFADFDYKSCPLLSRQSINLDMMSKRVELLDFLKFCLDENNYLYFIVNVKYISNYHYSVDSLHDIFVYGYDSVEDVFYIRDYFGKHLTEEKCPAHELIDGIRGASSDYSKLSFGGRIDLLALNESEHFCFSKKRVLDSLDDYLNGRGTTCWNILEHQGDYESCTWRYGLDTYEYLYNELTQGKIFIQDYQLLLEHKEQLIRILQYMSLGRDKDEAFIQELSNMRNQFLVLRNLGQKAMILSDTGRSICERMGEILHRLYTQEGELLQEIKKYYE